MTDLEKCPVCGSKWVGMGGESPLPYEWDSFQCGCIEGRDGETRIPCPEAHKIAIERGEEIKRLKEELKAFYDRDGYIWKDNPEPEEEK